MNKRLDGPLKPIPRLASEQQERAYWESHDSATHLDWSKAQKATPPNLKPTTKTISLRLPQRLLDSIKGRPTRAMCLTSR